MTQLITPKRARKPKAAPTVPPADVRLHTRSAPMRNSTVSATRKAVEAHLLAHLEAPQNLHMIMAATGLTNERAANMLGNMRTDNKVRIVGKVGRLQGYVHHTSALRPMPAAAPLAPTCPVAAPRTNSVMTGTYNGTELKPFEGRPGAMDAYSLPSKGIKA